MLFVVVFIGYNIGMFAVFKKIVQTQKGKALIAKPLLKLDRTKDWDKEWLLEEDRSHVVLKIEPCKLQFISNPQSKTDGFRWSCKCGKTGHGLTLSIAEYNFDSHKRKEKEIAIAALGRFK